MTATREHLAEQLLDLILEQCRYWQGRDEARRGNFASLYAEARELVNKAHSAEPVQGEAVEVVAWRVTGNGGLTVTPEYPVWAVGDAGLTIQPLYTSPAKPDAELVELLRDIVAEDSIKWVLGDSLMDRIDAKLAEVNKL